MFKTNRKKGFTLMELLIVIAIIVVLVAIAIPVFSKQLEKAKEATDAANIRAAYAEAASKALLTDEEVTVTSVEMAQADEGWAYFHGDIGGIANDKLPDVDAGDTVDVTVTVAGEASALVAPVETP